MKKGINLLKIVNEVALNNGVTYSIATGECNPDYGYMVSIAGFETKASYFDSDLLRSYIQSNAKELYLNDRYFGVWLDRGTYYLDVPILIEDKDEALNLAKKNNQLAIYDNKNKDVINL